MTKIIAIGLLLCAGLLSLPANASAAAACDYLRAQECEGEACLAKYKAIQDCEMAIIAEEQARSRRRMLQRQRDADTKRKKDLESRN